MIEATERKLRQRREALGLSREKFVIESGAPFTSKSLGFWERGARTPRPASAATWVAAIATLERRRRKSAA